MTNEFGVTLTDGVRHLESSLPVPYQYAVTQIAVPGWETTVTCTGGSIAGSGEDLSGNTYVHVEVADWGAVQCTFSNSYVGSTLTIDVRAPDDDQQVFSFHGSYTAPTGDTTEPGGEFNPDLRHGEAYTEAFIVGQGILLAVSEDIPAGWKLTGINCVEMVETPLLGAVPVPYSPSYVDLETGFLQLDPNAGADYRCTFTNDYVAGRLSFGPDVVSGDAAQSFRYSARLDHNVDVSLVEGAFYGEDLVTVPNQYAVVQKAQPGWETTVSCTGGSVAGVGTESDGDTYVHIDIGEQETARCTFHNTYVNEPPVADAGGPYVLNEGSSLSFDGGGSSDPDGDSLTYEWDLDNDGEYDDATGPTPLLFYPDGPAGYTIGLKVTDPLGESDTDTAAVTVNNVAPAVEAPGIVPSPSDEGAAAIASATFSDPAMSYDTYSCTVDYGDGSGPLAGAVSGYTCNGPSHVYADNGSYTVTVTVTDDDGGTGSALAVHEVLNVPPQVSVSSGAQTVQYSDLIDDITITATDVAADELTLTVTDVPGLQLDLESCSIASGVKTCEWTLSGPVRLPAGTHPLSVAVEDDDGGSATAEITLTVLHEDAVVAFGSDNPIVVPVTDAGSDESEQFSLFAYVHEAPESGDDVAPGDINLAEVSLTLEPVGPGSPIGPVTCISTGEVDAYDYSAVLEVSCDVSGIPVNAYVATVSIGGDYYQGNTDEDVVVVYDPSLGFTTGGGWFAWPGTGERTTFGYTMKYNKKATNVQGSMVVIRRAADGERYRLKSNAIFGLALGETSEMGWASFLGKATYLEPGMAEAEGNHTFMVYVEDRGEPGAGSDRFWIEVMDKGGNPVALSFDRPADGNAVELGGGNIVVPHKPRKGAR
jgi:PKD repeat protein